MCAQRIRAHESAMINIEMTSDVHILKPRVYFDVRDIMMCVVKSCQGACAKVWSVMVLQKSTEIERAKKAIWHLAGHCLRSDGDHHGVVL